MPQPSGVAGRRALVFLSLYWLGMMLARLALGAVLRRAAPGRVLLACLAYVGGIGAALVFAHGVPDAGMLMFALILLVMMGVGMTLWAFATRKRRRMPRSSRYYDN